MLAVLFPELTDNLPRVALTSRDVRGVELRSWSPAARAAVVEEMQQQGASCTTGWAMARVKWAAMQEEREAAIKAFSVYDRIVFHIIADTRREKIHGARQVADMIGSGTALVSACILKLVRYNLVDRYPTGYHLTHFGREVLLAGLVERA